jgi:hypothetical protein
MANYRHTMDLWVPNIPSDSLTWSFVGTIRVDTGCFIQASSQESMHLRAEGCLLRDKGHPPGGI